MLNRLRLQNFKAWEEAELEFGKVTGLFGANSAGKSSILDLLLLLKQTRNATDRGIVLEFGGPADLVNLGTFADVVHHHDENRRIRWLLEWTLPKPLTIKTIKIPLSPSTAFEGATLQTTCEVGIRDEGLWVPELGYRFADINFRLHEKQGSGREFQLTTTAGDFRFIRTQGRKWPLPKPIKTHLFPGEAKSYFQNSSFLSEFELQYEKRMDSLFYLGPLREHPKREYPWAGSRPHDVGQRGERTMDAILAATARGTKRSLGYKKRRKPFQEIISHWLRDLGLIHSFEIDEIAPGTRLYRTTVRTLPASAPTALTDVGFGVSQVLPVLVLLYYVPEGATVILEQPEIHLHPAVQSGLADVMLNVARTRHVQVIVESHSEHLLRRLQRRVAEGSARANDVRLYFASAVEGNASLSGLKLNEWGAIENWPDNFFGDEMGEIAAISEASLKRRLAGTQ
jgi:predicted ATPase